MKASFFDEVKSEIRRGGARLKMDILLERLDPKLREEVLTVLRLPRDEAPESAIAVALKRRGDESDPKVDMSITPPSIRHWREEHGIR